MNVDIVKTCDWSNFRCNHPGHRLAVVENTLKWVPRSTLQETHLMNRRHAVGQIGLSALSNIIKGYLSSERLLTPQEIHRILRNSEWVNRKLSQAEHPDPEVLALLLERLDLSTPHGHASIETGEEPNSSSAPLSIADKETAKEQKIVQTLTRFLDRPWRGSRALSLCQHLKQSPPAIKARLLAQRPDHPIIAIYYQIQPFLEDQAIDFHQQEPLSTDQWTLFSHLMTTRHEKTLEVLERCSPFRHYVLARTNRLAFHLQPLSTALSKLERLPASHPLVKHHVLPSLFFIEKNRQALHLFGRPSKHYPHLKKIKGKEIGLAYNLAYDLDRRQIAWIQTFFDKGSFKQVKKRIYFVEEQLFWKITAVAKQRFTSHSTALRTRTEIELMQKCTEMQAPHIVSLLRHEWIPYTGGVLLCTQEMPFYNMGSLDKYTCGKEQLRDLDRLLVAIDMINGVRNLHHLKIIHRDLKPANIFLYGTEDETIRAAIGDLGLACPEENHEDRKRLVGSLSYMAPEVLIRREAASFASDAWSIGIVLWQLFRPHTYMRLFERLQTRYELEHLVRQLEQALPPTVETSVDYVIWKLTQPRYNRMKLSQAAEIMMGKLRAIDPSWQLVELEHGFVSIQQTPPSPPTPLEAV